MMNCNIFEKAACSLPKSQACVADYIAKHPTEVAFMTIEQLAHVVGVSTTTVMRLASAIGCSGYTDMMQPLKTELLEEATPLSKFESMKQGSTTRSAFEKSFIEAETKMLSDTINYNDLETIEKAAELVDNAEHIYIIGYRISYMAMAYLYQCLQRIKSNCTLLQPGGFDQLETISRIGEKDVVIGCTLPRYYSLVPDVIRSAKAQGAGTIVFTDSYNSPVANCTDALLMCNCQGASFHASILGAVYIADYLTAVVARRNPEATSDYLSKVEVIFSEYRKKIM